MKKTMFLRAIGLSFAFAAPAGAQQDAPATIDGVARSASLMRQIGEACPLLMDVNKDLADRYVQAFGKEAFHKKLATEYARRAAEVKKQTPETWCLDQRARLKDMGGADLFKK